MEFADYEIEILRALLKPEFSQPEIEDLIMTGSITGFDFTGVGYFLEISSNLLPKERKVISNPIILGKTNKIEVGFVLFIENNTLLIECFSLGVNNLPENIRTLDLKLELANKKE
jgi:hypothetical protein